MSAAIETSIVPMTIINYGKDISEAQEPIIFSFLIQPTPFNREMKNSS
jgi:hypothetical protein